MGGLGELLVMDEHQFRAQVSLSAKIESKRTVIFAWLVMEEGLAPLVFLNSPIIGTLAEDLLCEGFFSPI